MLLTKALLALPLLFLGSTPVTAQTPNGPATGVNGSRVPHGSLDGKWDLPNAMSPGSMTGVFKNRAGQPIMRLAATLVRDAAAPSTGTISGLAVVISGPRAGTKLPFRGQWQADARGEGQFRGVLLGKKRPGSPPHVVVKLRGGFKDMAPAGTPGVFRGRWHAKKKK